MVTENMRKGIATALLIGILFIFFIGYSKKPGGHDLSRSKEIAFAAMNKYNCVNCHTIDGAPGNKNAIAAPRLNQIGLRRSKEWIMRWMENPPAIKPGTVMPIFPLLLEQQEAIADYLISLSTPVDSQSILKNARNLEKAGAKLIEAYNCLACHNIKGNTASIGRKVGPDLTHIASRKTVTGDPWSKAWEVAWLDDPVTKKPGTYMPKFNLTDEEIKAIVAYLATMK